MYKENCLITPFVGFMTTKECFRDAFTILCEIWRRLESSDVQHCAVNIHQISHMTWYLQQKQKYINMDECRASLNHCIHATFKLQECVRARADKVAKITHQKKNNKKAWGYGYLHLQEEIKMLVRCACEGKPSYMYMRKSRSALPVLALSCQATRLSPADGSLPRTSFVCRTAADRCYRLWTHGSTATCTTSFILTNQKTASTVAESYRR